MKYCIYCGYPLEPGERFCGSCGNPIEVEYKEEYQLSPLEHHDDEEGVQPPFSGYDDYEEGVQPSSSGYHDYEEDVQPSSSWHGDYGEEGYSPSFEDYGVEDENHHPSLQQAFKRGGNGVLVAIASVLTIAILFIAGYFIIYPHFFGSDEFTGNNNFVDEGVELSSEEQIQEGSLDETEVGNDIEVESETEDEDIEDLATDYAFDIEELNRVIQAQTESRNVAVAILDLSTGDIHYTENGNNQFVAAGFYAPLYVVVREYYASNASLLEIASEMMGRTVDQIWQMNDEANTIISGVGDLAGINRRLGSMGFTATHFGRFFGTTGGQNYTSAREAAQILERVYQTGTYRRMSFNLGAEGINLPSNATFNSHRGSGVGNSYNVFAVVETQTGNYVVVILTDHIGQDGAIPVVTDVLREVQRQMELVNE